MIYPIEELKNQIEKNLKKTLSELNYNCEIKLERPPEEIGDFAFPCFNLAPIAKKSPNIIAEEISNKIKNIKWVKKIENKSGYVNFKVDDRKYTQKILESIDEKKDKYGFLKNKNKKVIIEHTSANPNGPLHIGRARNPIIGDTMVRIFKTAGYDVESQFYLDDMGKQVAILAWGVKNIKPETITEPDINKPDHKTVAFYQEASKKMNDNINILEEINSLIKKSEEGNEKTINDIHKAYKPVLEGINESLKNINITVDKYIPESKFVKDKSVNLVIEKLKKSKYCAKEQGAYYLDMKHFGIKGRNTKFFFLRKNGTSLYATRDIAYHIWKSKKAEKLINILGEDHKLESRQVEIVLKMLKTKIIPHVIFYSFVSLPGGKMSTRKGRVVYLDHLIDECIKRAYDEVNKRRGHELTEEKMKKIAKIIAIGALRYNIIKIQPEKDIVFKWEDALNFEGNSAPFIQYSHARASSIISKAKKTSSDKYNQELIKHKTEIKLIKKLGEYPQIIIEACENFKPHLITTYLFELSSQFNQFYRDCPVLIEKTELKKARLNLVNSTKIVLKNGLNLLGIQAPEEM